MPTSLPDELKGKRDDFISRRRVLIGGGALLGSALAGPSLARGGAASIIEEFSNSSSPEGDGIELEIPGIADNANAVPVRIRLTEPMMAGSYCEELIVVAERNPRPLACRFRFRRMSVSQMSPHAFAWRSPRP